MNIIQFFDVIFEIIVRYRRNECCKKISENTARKKLLYNHYKTLYDFIILYIGNSTTD